MSSNITRIYIEPRERIRRIPAQPRLATVTPMQPRRRRLEIQWSSFVLILIVCVFAAVFVKSVLLPVSEILSGSASDGWATEGP